VVAIFHIASPQEIKEGKVTDVYFVRAVEALRAKGIKKFVKAEVRTVSLPNGYSWAVLAGVEEALRLLEGLPVDVYCLPEGTVFKPYEPVLRIEGEYTEFAIYETALLGLLCQASGVATKAARCKKAAEGKPVYNFGARRMHPAIAPMIGRSAYIGGLDGVATIKAAEIIEKNPVGTMPHAFILIVGEPGEAFKIFDEVMPPEVKRVALVDTIGDEKFEAVRAAQVLGENLFAVRLDTPGSRRGNMAQILREVRWELDLRGFENVRIFVSGGLDELSIKELASLADAFGVGTSISSAPVINFAMDVVEIEGEPIAKRGKESGAKDLLVCEDCGERKIVPAGKTEKCSNCGRDMANLMKAVIKDGNVIGEFPSPEAIREYVLSQIEGLDVE